MLTCSRAIDLNRRQTRLRKGAKSERNSLHIHFLIIESGECAKYSFQNQCQYVTTLQSRRQPIFDYLWEEDDFETRVSNLIARSTLGWNYSLLHI